MAPTVSCNACGHFGPPSGFTHDPLNSGNTAAEFEGCEVCGSDHIEPVQACTTCHVRPMEVDETCLRCEGIAQQQCLRVAA